MAAPFTKPIIQIAGIRSHREAEMLVDKGVRYLGFPHRLSIHKEDIAEEETRAIISRLPHDVHNVLITYLDRAEDIVELATYLGTDTVQIHGDIAVEEIKKLARDYAALDIIKSLVVTGDNEAMLKEMIRQYNPYVSAFITDTYDPKTGARGATGMTHDWDISRRIVESSDKPVILAGGLTPSNVADAISAVQPAGVDSHTGVEDDAGWKDPDLVELFVKEATMAFESRHR
jgi:phosphoribosylanthranilate isomerase